MRDHRTQLRYWNKSNIYFIFTFRYFRKYWRHVWNWKYGNCYTFNFGAAEDNTTLALLRTNKAGPKYGWYGFRSSPSPSQLITILSWSHPVIMTIIINIANITVIQSYHNSRQTIFPCRKPYCGGERSITNAYLCNLFISSLFLFFVHSHPLWV